jgi:large subunit ribosomal protein L21
MNRIRSFKDLEFECNLIERNSATSKMKITSAQVQVGNPTVDGAKVAATVISHVKGDKVIVFKKKRRKTYQKWNNHRQSFTQILIQGVLAKGDTLKDELKAEKKVWTVKPAAKTEKVSVEKEVKKAAPKKAAAKKAAPKKAAAKKTAKKD